MMRAGAINAYCPGVSAWRTCPPTKRYARPIPVCAPLAGFSVWRRAGSWAASRRALRSASGGVSIPQGSERPHTRCGHGGRCSAVVVRTPHLRRDLLAIPRSPLGRIHLWQTAHVPVDLHPRAPRDEDDLLLLGEPCDVGVVWCSEEYTITAGPCSHLMCTFAKRGKWDAAMLSVHLAMVTT